MQSFYESLKSACKDRHVSMTGMLEDLGRSPGCLSSWKSGSFPHINMVIEIANYLNMSLDDLVFGTTSAKAPIDDVILDCYYSLPSEYREVALNMLINLRKKYGVIQNNTQFPEKG